MQRPARTHRVHALALPRPASDAVTEWWVAAAAVGLLLAALLGP
jgi:cbb3-type cytochrome oxidase subunit 1